MKKIKIPETVKIDAENEKGEEVSIPFSFKKFLRGAVLQDKSLGTGLDNAEIARDILKKIKAISDFPSEKDELLLENEEYKKLDNAVKNSQYTTLVNAETTSYRYAIKDAEDVNV